MICAACQARRCHTPEELRNHHPLAGHSFTPETGWTHPEAERLHLAAVPANAIPGSQFCASVAVERAGFRQLVQTSPPEAAEPRSALKRSGGFPSPIPPNAPAGSQAASPEAK